MVSRRARHIPRGDGEEWYRVALVSCHEEQERSIDQSTRQKLHTEGQEQRRYSLSLYQDPNGLAFHQRDEGQSSLLF